MEEEGSSITTSLFASSSSSRSSTITDTYILLSSRFVHGEEDKVFVAALCAMSVRRGLGARKRLVMVVVCGAMILAWWPRETPRDIPPSRTPCGKRATTVERRTSESESCNAVGSEAQKMSRSEVFAAREWMSKVVKSLNPSQLEALGRRTRSMGAWASSEGYLAGNSPVLYPFSGADLFTAVGLFGDSPAYTLVAEFDAGNASCLSSCECANLARKSATKYFRHVADRDFEYTNTAQMADIFEGVGVLPSLLLSASVLGWTLVGGSADAADEYTTIYLRQPVASRFENDSGRRPWRCVRITYARIWIDQTRDVDKLLSVAARGSSPSARQNARGVVLQPPPFVACFKAGPHNVTRVRWFSEAVLEKARLVVQDESGIDISALLAARIRAGDGDRSDSKRWRVTPYGTFVDFLPSQRDLYVSDAQKLREFYASRPRRLLPFCYGYCQVTKNGTLVAALKPTKRHSATQPLVPKICVVLSVEKKHSRVVADLLSTRPDTLVVNRSLDSLDRVQHLENALLLNTEQQTKLVLMRASGKSSFLESIQGGDDVLLARWLRANRATYIHIDSRYPYDRADLDRLRSAHRRLVTWADSWADPDTAVHAYFEDFCDHQADSIQRIRIAFGLES